MIVDSFLFYNEYDILEGRLEYLYDKVDFFVIVESNLTFSGKPKPLNFLNNMSRYKQYLDKIFYYPLYLNREDFSKNEKDWLVEESDLAPRWDSPTWQVEYATRNYIKEALKFFNPDTIVLMSDVDEIPRKNAIDTAITEINSLTSDICRLGNHLFYYNFCQREASLWSGTIICRNSFLQEKGPQTLKHWGWGDLSFLMPEGGYHLSYWGDVDSVSSKIEAGAHQELNKQQFTDKSNIEKRIQEGLDPFDRQTLIRADPREIDPEIWNIFSKYNKGKINHYYENVEGWFSPDDAQCYKKVIEEYANSQEKLHFVEIGSYKGRSASFLAVEIANSNLDVKFDCVDIWEPNTQYEDLDYNTFINNMRPVENYYNAIRLPSLEACALYTDNSLDMVFIDALHDYKSVKADLIHWYAKVKPGGIIAGHDFMYPDVNRAVQEVLGDVLRIGDCYYYIKQ
jgi:beta-1,4-mannosyl-glycoprotein beta-1,4-N-acetylglucosaminyltransferase